VEIHVFIEFSSNTNHLPLFHRYKSDINRGISKDALAFEFLISLSILNQALKIFFSKQINFSFFLFILFKLAIRFSKTL
jgi:hypothetical protein